VACGYWEFLYGWNTSDISSVGNGKRTSRIRLCQILLVAEPVCWKIGVISPENDKMIILGNFGYGSLDSLPNFRDTPASPDSMAARNHPKWSEGKIEDGKKRILYGCFKVRDHALTAKNFIKKIFLTVDSDHASR